MIDYILRHGGVNTKVVCPFCFGKGEYEPCQWAKDCVKPTVNYCKNLGLKKRPVCFKKRELTKP
jgi:hypothetical protein